jgi:hypothetical protein
MSLTPVLATPTANLEKTIVRPDSITTVYASSSPNTGSFSTTTKYTLYTAPASCKYAKIYWRKSTASAGAGREYAASNFPSVSTADYYFFLEITDGINSREIIRAHNGAVGFTFNNFNNTNLEYTPVLQENDTLVGMESGYFIMSGDAFTLAPGEKLQLGTGSNNNSAVFYANFQAWVYN